MGFNFLPLECGVVGVSTWAAVSHIVKIANTIAVDRPEIVKVAHPDVGTSKDVHPIDANK